MADYVMDRQEFSDLISKEIVNIPDLKIKELECNSVVGLVIFRKNHVFFPNEASLEKCSKGLTVGESEKLQAAFFNPVRIVITKDNLKASLQVFQQEIEHETPVISFSTTENSWKVSNNFVNLLKKLSAFGGFEVCRGLPPNAVLTNNDIKSAPRSLLVQQWPFIRIVTRYCSGVTKCNKSNYNNPPEEEIMQSLNSTRYRCRSCIQYLYNLKSRQKKTPPQKRKLDPDSSCGLRNLTPQSKKRRLTNIRIQRATLRKSLLMMEAKKINQLEVTHSDDQSQEMSGVNVMDAISKNKDCSEELENVKMESGELEFQKTLQRAWKTEKNDT